MSRDYTGQRFNKLIVLSAAEARISPNGKVVKRFNCLCDCGSTRVVDIVNLLNGNIKSCGCYRAPNKNRKNLVGQTFGRLTVISEDAPRLRINGLWRRVWVCRCECGTVKSILHSNLTSRNGIRSCGCLHSVLGSKPVSLIGNRYGFLTVIRKAQSVSERSEYNTYWECICDCGKERIVKENNLRSGHTRSCGCLTGNMKAGRRFGKLVLLSRAPAEHSMRYWHCRCDCGRELTVSTDTLFRAPNICCECRNGPKPSADLTGKVYGRLTVLMEVDPVIDSSGKKHLSWLCRCICGREVVVRDQNLKNKITRSCGCLRQRAKKRLW